VEEELKDIAKVHDKTIIIIIKDKRIRLLMRIFNRFTQFLAFLFYFSYQFPLIEILEKIPFIVEVPKFPLEFHTIMEVPQSIYI
jgi:hypothetical protein